MYFSLKAYGYLNIAMSEILIILLFKYIIEM